MRQLKTQELTEISGGKSAKDFYLEIIKPTVIGGGSVIGGLGGGTAGLIIVHGVEGFIESAPEAMKALEHIHKLSDEEIAKIMKDPYRYAD